MDIEVRLATAQDRPELERFYNQEGFNFRTLAARSPFGFGDIKETMYIVARADGEIIAALKLDIVINTKRELVGIIRHFEIKDQLEDTDLGDKMLEKVGKIAEERGFSAIEYSIDISRKDVIKLLLDNGFIEVCREVRLRRSFRPSPFK